MTTTLSIPTDLYERHQRRLHRLACHKRRTLGLAQWLAEQGLLTPRLARLAQCQSWLVFRYEPEAARIRLSQTMSCDLPLLCPLCAIRRAARAGAGYQQRALTLLATAPDLRLFYAVLTIQNQADLAERFEHLQHQARLLLTRRQAAASAQRGHPRLAYACATSLAAVIAGAYSFEVKRGRNSGLWHPHLNLLLLAPQPIDEHALTAEWHALTGDSYIVYCQPRPPDTGTFVEIFKYALKFADLSYADTFWVYQTLHGRKLMGSFGAFRGLRLPPEAAPPVSAYRELFYRYCAGEYCLAAEPETQRIERS